MRILRKSLIYLAFSLYAIGTFFSNVKAADEASTFVISLHGEVNDAMASYLERELKVAQGLGVQAIIDIDTWGGQVISADKISSILMDTPVETTAFVSGKAISAGVVLTISCDNVAMAPDSYIGAAEVVPFSEKGLSVVKGLLSTIAQSQKRPEEVILAMADKRIVIDGVSKEGELLTLSSLQAKEQGICDEICNDINEVLKVFDLGNDYQRAQYTTADKVASAITSSIALNIFFTLGFALVILEIFTVGFGVAGFGAIICFALYFFGGVIAGITQWWAIVLFVAGGVSLAIEMAVPGFGVFGFTGLVLSLLGLIFSASSIEQFATMVVITIIVCAILIPICIIVFGKIKIWDKVINSENQTVDAGYTATDESNESLIGRVAIVITPLRPSGIIRIDNKRMDAVSRGDYIEVGKEVEIVEIKSCSLVVDKRWIKSNRRFERK